MRPVRTRAPFCFPFPPQQAVGTNRGRGDTQGEAVGCRAGFSGLRRSGSAAVEHQGDPTRGGGGGATALLCMLCLYVTRLEVEVLGNIDT